MNNQELYNVFAEIAQISNCFDRELALRKLNREYKKSDFFKQTWTPIHKAFLLYQANAFNSLACIINSTAVSALLSGDTFVMKTALERFFADFDVSCLDEITNYITEKLEGFSLDNTSMLNTLQQVIKEFKGSLK